MSPANARTLLAAISHVVRTKGSAGTKATVIMEEAQKNDQLYSEFTEFLSWFLEGDDG